VLVFLLRLIVITEQGLRVRPIPWAFLLCLEVAIVTGWIVLRARRP
jgi:hypothetical protein